jgi:hypothetical protein
MNDVTAEVQQEVAQQSDPTPQPIRRRRPPQGPRAAPRPSPAFFILQVLDENGTPVQFDKRRMKIVSIERSAEKVLDLVESGDHPNAFYLRGLVPVARAPQQRTRTPAPAA